MEQNVQTAMQVTLYKKNGTYIDKDDGKEKRFTRFYLECGDNRIPIEVCFFRNEEGRDPVYASRKAVLSAFAATLPEKNVTDEKSEELAETKAVNPSSYSPEEFS